MCPENFDQTEERSHSRRWISDVAAGAVLCAFFIFMTGYFIGKRGAVEEVTHHAERDSFADCIYSSFQGLRDDGKHEIVALAQLTDANDGDVVSDSPLLAGRIAGVATLDEASFDVADAGDQSTKYYAQLAGFRTAKAASKLSTRLGDRGVPSEVKRRVSRTARGAEHAWYQVITTVYNDRSKLKDVVDRVCREEKINGAQIVTC